MPDRDLQNFLHELFAELWGYAFLALVVALGVGLVVVGGRDLLRARRRGRHMATA